MTPRFFAPVLALTLCAVATAAQQQPAKPQDPQPPLFRTEANFVRVDVYATQNNHQNHRCWL